MESKRLGHPIFIMFLIGTLLSPFEPALAQNSSQAAQDLQQARDRLAHFHSQLQSDEDFSEDTLRVSLKELRQSQLFAEGQEDSELAHALAAAIRQAEDRLAYQTITRFRSELRAEIQAALQTEPNRAIYRDLEAAAACLEIRGPTLPVLQLVRNIFENIFQLFGRKPELTNQDCDVLRKTYALWGSFHETQNDATEAIADTLPAKQIPLYNVNAHNASVIYWLREMARGNIPAGGLPLLHADTHSDLAHVHDHLNGSHWAHHASVAELGELLRLSDKSAARKYLAEKILPQMKEMGEEAKVKLLSRLERNRDGKWLQSEVERSLRERIHYIAQPVTAAVAAGITNKVIMCMPPWSTEFNRTPGRPGELEIASRWLKRDPEKGTLLFDEELYTPANSVRIKALPFGVVDCNTERRDSTSGKISVKTQTELGIPDLSQFFARKETAAGFILDIDLDVFVSEGVSQEQGTPISFARTKTHEKKEGAHGSHAANSETDPRTEVATLELGLIQKRIEYFFAQLKKAKDAGILPKVITISDSTLLNRAYDRLRQDNADGGNYTPTCLAFLVNYKVRKELERLYPTRAFR